jgi:hypothetical protein
MSSSVSYSPRAKLAISGLKVAKELVKRSDPLFQEWNGVRFSDVLNIE